MFRQQSQREGKRMVEPRTKERKKSFAGKRMKNWKKCPFAKAQNNRQDFTLLKIHPQKNKQHPSN